MKSIKRKLAYVSNGSTFDVAPLRDTMEKIVGISMKVAMQKYIADPEYREDIDVKHTNCDGMSRIQEYNMKVNCNCRFSIAGNNRKVQALLLNETEKSKS